MAASQFDLPLVWREDHGLIFSCVNEKNRPPLGLKIIIIKKQHRAQEFIEFISKHAHLWSTKLNLGTRQINI